MEHTVSGVGVLDKSILVLNCVSGDKCSLAEIVDRTGLSRATAHRLAVALEAHGLLRRTVDGRFALGLHLLALGRASAEQFPLADRAQPAMEALRDETGESVQLYAIDGDSRVCVAALESPHGLRTIVPVGAALPMEKGSAGRALSGEVGCGDWVDSIEEREPGVASVSAAVSDGEGAVIAAISISGPLDRMGPTPGDRHGPAVVRAAAAASSARA